MKNIIFDISFRTYQPSARKDKAICGIDNLGEIHFRRDKMAQHEDTLNGANSSKDTSTLILAIDIGSSSVRCIAYDLNLHPIVSIASKLQAINPNGGSIRISQVITTVESCIDSMLKNIRQKIKEFTIVRVCISSFVMNLIGIADDEIVENGTLSYACNLHEVGKECGRLIAMLGNEYEQYRQRTGCCIHSSYALPQLIHFYSKCENSEKLIQLPQLWTTISSFLISKWTGASDVADIPISFSEASWTGMFNFRKCCWDYNAILPDKCRDCLPKIQKGNESFFISDNSKYGERWPELRNAELHLGVGDGACANIGSKATNTNRIAVTIGTSAACRAILKLGRVGADEDSLSFEIPPGLWCYRIDLNHVLLGGAITDGGSVIEWARELMNLTDDDAFEKCLNEVYAMICADSNDLDRQKLIMLPFLSGERSTGWRDGATGMVYGLSRKTTQADFLRCAMEGVMLRISAVLRLLISEMEKRSHDEIVILVSGKALECNATWRKMLANFSRGLCVVVDAEGVQESTSRGAALLASSVGWPNEEAIFVKHKEITPLNESSFSLLDKQESLITSISKHW